MSAYENRLVRTIYDYESNDDKILTFKSGDMFIILKPGDDYSYVVSAYGRLGYIPTSFFESTILNDNEYLQFVKNVLCLLESSLTKNPNITKRQINHAQVKLTQLRCEIVKKLAKLTPITPEPNNKQSFFSDDSEKSESNHKNDESISKLDNCKQNEENTEISNNERLIETTDFESSSHRFSNQDINLKSSELQSDKQMNLNIQSQTQISQLQQQSIPNNLTLELLEKVRISTNLNYNVCKLTLKSILGCLKLNLPQWHDDCNTILRQINSCDQNISKEFIFASTDYLEMKSLFNKLWFCKNDEQQRCWPIQEDEEQIKFILNSLSNILKNANPKISKEIISENNCENISLLITYFQMENRVLLKLELYSVFLQIIRLLPNVIEEIMLPSVLPGSLCNELINYKTDSKRWSLASKLFTSIFSSGNKPPIDIYDYINEQFINSLLDLVEEPNPTDQIHIPPEYSIPPIISFNLHFNQDEDDYNYVMNSLRNRSSASHLLENLLMYLNWDEDPTRLTYILANEINDQYGNLYYDQEQLEQIENQLNRLSNNKNKNSKKKNQTHKIDDHQPNRVNAVHKLLLEIFNDEIISNLFYYNDICVLVDVIVTFLNNLHSDDKDRLTYLKLFLRVCQNTNYKDQPHKLKEILKCLKLVLNDEHSSPEEKKLAEIAIELFV